MVAYRLGPWAISVLLLLTACGPVRARHRAKSSGFYAPAACIDHISFEQPCESTSGTKLKCQNVVVDEHCVAPVGKKVPVDPQKKIPVSYGDPSGKRQ